MTPERAAELLAVPADAIPAEIERAFTRAARSAHPDLFVDDDDATRARRAAEFVSLAEARDLLVARARARAAAAATGYRPPDARPTIPPPPGPYLMGAWIGMLVLAAFLSIYAAPHPFTVAEPVARWLIFGTALVAFGRTGLRPLLVVAIVALLATVITTILLTTLGGLLALLAVLVPVLGLVQAGLAMEQRRLRAMTVEN